MRISDWSSDVFSSDLRDRRWRRRERTSQRERSKEQTFFQNVIGSARGTNIGHRFATATMCVWKASAKICRRGMMHLLPAAFSSARAAHCQPPMTLAFARVRSEEHTSALQSLMRSSYAVLCLQKKQHISK